MHPRSNVHFRVTIHYIVISQRIWSESCNGGLQNRIQIYESVNHEQKQMDTKLIGHVHG
jgi:hypothetical protein